MPLRAELYPDYQRGLLRELPGVADEFDVLRERMLLRYGYQTARAYWADLEHWRDWCLSQHPPVQPLGCANEDLSRYLAAIEALGYAPTTLARRRSVLRRFGALGASEAV